MFDHLVGIPYKLHGRDLSGMDCVAVILAGLDLLGAPTACPWSGIRSLCISQKLPDPSHYPTGWRLLDGGEIPQIGDVLTLQQPKQMAHLALLIGPSIALTTTAKTGSYICRVSRLPGSIRMRFRPPHFEEVVR